MRKIRNLDNYLYDNYGLNYARDYYEESEEIIGCTHKGNICEWEYDYFITFKDKIIKLRKIVVENIMTNTYETYVYELK